MKMLIVCVLIIRTLPLIAQEQKEEVQNLPELQEWYSWKGGTFPGSIISYLPDFDSVNGGTNAITQGRGKESPTWYNRFPYDTTNQFTWPNDGAYYIVYGDFNGDGIRDYWTVNDYVYRGIKKKSPPSPEPDTNYFLGDYRGYKWVADYNGDGYDDLLQQWDNSICTDCPLYRIVWGGKDLKRLKQSTGAMFSNLTFGKMIGIYRNENNQWRIISFETNKGEEIFYLYDVIINNGGEIPTVQLKKLDRIIKYKQNENDRFYSMFLTNFYTDKKRNKNYIISGYENESKAAVIEATNSELIERSTVNTSIGTPNILNESIDGDNANDFICLTQINKQTNEQRFALYSGNEVEQLTPRALLPKSVCGLTGMISYIGDVNNDGYNDIAMGGDNCFRVFLGLDWKATGIKTASTTDIFALHENEPNPIGKDRKTVLPISVNATGNYIITVYNTRGVNIKELYNGFLNEGEIKLPLDLSGLSAGMYILKMSDGYVQRERLIIIGE